MKKILLVLTILLLIAAIVSIFIPANIQATTGGPGGPEETEDPRDPHFHTGTWTTCCNELPRACGSS